MNGIDNSEVVFVLAPRRAFTLIIEIGIENYNTEIRDTIPTFS